MKKALLLFAAVFAGFMGFAQGYDVTFRVDMNEYTGSFTTPEVNGDFNSWCGDCAPMDDSDGDGIWELVINIDQDSAEFKFAADNWNIQENLTPASPCTKTTGNFTNRFIVLTGDTVLPTVCWESCVACGAVGPTSDVTFKVDMNDYPGSFTTPEINGTFNGWCGNCTPMTDADNDGVWEVTVNVPTDTIEYKFSFDNWTGQENLTQGLPCTKTTQDASGTFTNRVLVVEGDNVLDAVCWESCDACGTTGTDELSEAAGLTVMPNPTYGEVLITGDFSTSEERTLTVYDLSGREVVSRTVGGAQITERVDLSSFGKGVYLIALRGTAQTFTEKVVVVD